MGGPGLGGGAFRKDAAQLTHKPSRSRCVQWGAGLRRRHRDRRFPAGMEAPGPRGQMLQRTQWPVRQHLPARSRCLRCRLPAAPSSASLGTGLRVAAPSHRLQGCPGSHGRPAVGGLNGRLPWPPRDQLSGPREPRRPGRPLLRLSPG